MGLPKTSVREGLSSRLAPTSSQLSLSRFPTSCAYPLPCIVLPYPFPTLIESTVLPSSTFPHLFLATHLLLTTPSFTPHTVSSNHIITTTTITVPPPHPSILLPFILLSSSSLTLPSSRLPTSSTFPPCIPPTSNVVQYLIPVQPVIPLLRHLKKKHVTQSSSCNPSSLSIHTRVQILWEPTNPPSANPATTTNPIPTQLYSLSHAHILPPNKGPIALTNEFRD